MAGGVQIDNVNAWQLDHAFRIGRADAVVSEHSFGSCLFAPWDLQPHVICGTVRNAFAFVGDGFD